jgi:malonyl-CoA/methylmalonyl-CoA synthetase
MTNHLFQKIRDAIEGRESLLFLETPAGFALTYAGMIALSGRYAEALAGLGLKPGDRVAAQVEKSVEALMLYLGAIRAGAIFLPLDIAYTSASL